MAKISNFRTDLSKEVEGTWIDAGAGLKLRIARIGNPQYRDYVKKHSKTLVNQARRGEMDLDEAIKINKDAAAKYILLDWQNLQDDDGAEIPYSQAKAREFLDISDFHEMVMGFANDMSNFKADEVESAKNSKAASGGSSTGRSTSQSSRTVPNAEK